MRNREPRQVLFRYVQQGAPGQRVGIAWILPQDVFEFSERLAPLSPVRHLEPCISAFGVWVVGTHLGTRLKASIALG